MNIGFFTDTYFPQVSGVSTSIKTLAEQLRKQGHSVYIFTTTDPKIKKTEYGIGDEKFIYRFSSIPFSGFKDRRIVFRGFFDAIEIAKILRLDIVHTHTEFSLGIMGKIISRQMKIPHVHTYHTMYSEYTHYLLNGHLIKPKNVSQLIHTYLKNTSAVIAPSEKTKKVLLSYKIKSPIKIIPSGVSFSKDVKDFSMQIRKKYGIKNSTKIILSLGRIAPEKSLPELLDAFKIVLKKNNNVILLVAGDGPSANELKDYAIKLGIKHNIIFTGMINYDDVYSYYKVADIFVSASTTETQGITFIEATNAGTPFISKPNTFLKPLVVDKSVGVFVNNTNEIAEAIQDYLLHPEYKENNSIRVKQIKKISASAFGKNIESFYQEVISNYKPKKSVLKALTSDEQLLVGTIMNKIPNIVNVRFLKRKGPK
ncbi:MAG: glycosyltransferase family 4 protein [Lactobacillaceae bacterium]|jgi:1,2-diacylglycerol 3-alpha-glucosyltransferase|nr:glycosyltransferase family 4 protein [Lactobacillaceae bacterium]